MGWIHSIGIHYRSLTTINFQRAPFANFSPSRVQFFVCTLCGRVFSWQRGLTHRRHSTNGDVRPNSTNLSVSDGLDSKLADDIPQFDDDSLSQPPETEICPITGSPIDDTLQVVSIKDDDLDPLAPFAIPQWSLLCRSNVYTYLGKIKVHNIIKRRLIIPAANATKHDKLYQLIADMQETDRLLCGWGESSVNIEGNATAILYWNPIGVV